MKTYSPFEKQPLASLEDLPIVDSRDAKARNLKILAYDIKAILGYDPTKHTRGSLSGDDPTIGSGFMELHKPANGGMNIANELESKATDLEIALDKAPDENMIPVYLKYINEARIAAKAILDADREVKKRENAATSFARRKIS